VIGLRWNLLILREVFRGVYRFQDLQRNLEISRKTLARRLEMLVAHEILERRRYEPRTDRYEYWPTRKGSDLRPVLMTLASWGERYASPPRRLGRHDSNEDVQSANGQSVP